jgi:hypothetical protein
MGIHDCHADQVEVIGCSAVIGAPRRGSTTVERSENEIGQDLEPASGSDGADLLIDPD